MAARPCRRRSSLIWPRSTPGAGAPVSRRNLRTPFSTEGIARHLPPLADWRNCRTSHPPDLRSTGLRAPASVGWRTTSSNCGSANPSGWRRNVRWPIFPACSRVEDEQRDGELIVRLQTRARLRGRAASTRKSSYIVDIEPFNFDVPEPDITAGRPDSRPGDPLAPPLIAADTRQGG